MKKMICSKVAVLAACCVALPVGGLFAQAPAPSPSPATTPSVSVPADTTPVTAATPPAGEARGKGRHKMQERLAALTPEEREKLMAARRKALEDPAVKTAETTRATDRKGYARAMREAMLRADPSVGPIIEKMREGRPRKKNL